MGTVKKSVDIITDINNTIKRGVRWWRAWRAESYARKIEKTIQKYRDACTTEACSDDVPRISPDLLNDLLRDIAKNRHKRHSRT